jgi:hypothetical protein
LTRSRRWPELRNEALESLDILSSLLRSESSNTRLIDGYLETKTMLATAFQALVLESLESRIGLLPAIKIHLEEEIRGQFETLLDPKYLPVKGYGKLHAELLAYLSFYINVPVPANALRVLTADAVHTERRLRELRDLGLNLVSMKTGGGNKYVLESLVPDLQNAASVIVRLNIQNDNTLPESQKRAMLQTLSRSNPT